MTLPESANRLKRITNYDYNIYKITSPYDERFANAFAIKIKKTFQIWVSEDLLDILDESETLSIIAHEIGHHFKGHNFKYKLLFILKLLYYLVLANFILVNDALYTSFGYVRVSGAFASFIVIILYGFFNRLLIILSNYVSRKFEYTSDLFSSKLYGSKELSKALLKVYQFNLMIPHLHPVDEFLNSTHPSLINRLKAIDDET